MANTQNSSVASTWKETLVNRLRFLIHDITHPRTYSDVQLATFISIAAVAVAAEVDLQVTFNFDTDTPDISPDPTSSAVDAGISALFIAKAACMITGGEFRRDISKYGIKIRDHLTAYDGTNALTATGKVAGNFCQAYEDLKEEWEMLNRTGSTYGRAIIGPHTYTGDTLYSGRFALDWSKNSPSRER